MVGAGEQENQLVLGPVGVLILVDQDVAEPLLVVLEHIGTGLEQVDGDQQQVVEVHGVGGQQTVLVLAVDLGDAALHDGSGPGRVGLEVDQLVLGGGDQGVHDPGRELLGVEIELPDDIAREADGIGLVVDGEVSLVAQPAGVPAQQAHTGGVEGRHPHPPGDGTDQGLHPLAHLLGSLVGEGYGQDLERGHALLGDQPGDAVGEHPGLAGPGASHDQERTTRMGDRPGLDGVEPGEQVGLGIQDHGPFHGTAAYSHSMVPGGLEVMS